MSFRKLLSLFICLLAGTALHAQELACKVRIMHEKIEKTDPAVFTAMEHGINEFLANRRWTSDEFGNTERIDCNVLINITDKNATDPDLYTATLSIQATRPVYNTGYTTPIINYVDRDVVFHFSQYTSLQFDDNRVSGSDPLASNLTAILAYYAYLTIGLDYDSFSPDGGTTIFKKAQNIVQNAPEQGGDIHGWKAFEDKRNRYWIIDQLLSPRYAQLRSYWYSMHREGLDVLYNKPQEGNAKILAGISILNQLQKDNPGSTLLQFFFNSKSDELLRIVAQLPREERNNYLTILSATDASNAVRYSNLK